MRKYNRHILLLLALFSLMLIVCKREPQYDILLVTLDTTRADRIGCYGYSGALTPCIDSLAADGATLFENAWTVAPVTLPAHTSIMTGLYPPTHGVRDNGIFRLEDRALTLAEILNKKGYDTAAFVAAYVLNSRYGLAQGFDHYDQDIEKKEERGAGFIVERSADKVADRFIEYMKDKKTDEGPLFNWVHFFDPHSPYNPPDPFHSALKGRPYDGEIAFMDSQLGRVIEELKQSGRYDRTLIIVAGDHGEALEEHGEPTHGIFIYNPTVKVPYIIRLPGGNKAAGSLQNNVSLVDILPTILDFLELSAPDIQGSSLLPLLRNESETEYFAERELYLETHLPVNTFGWHEVEGLVYKGRKVIYAPLSEMYDLKSDPGETENLAESDSAGFHGMMNRFLRRRLSLEHALDYELAGRMSLDSESEERLRALGYVSRGAGGSGERERPDPKLMIATLGRFIDGVVAEAEKDYPKAESLLTSVIEEDPNNTYARVFLGFVQLGDGKPSAAIESFEGAFAVDGSVNAAYFLGQTYLSLDSTALAREWFERTIAIDPSHPRAHFLLGEVLSRMGEEQKALEMMEKALDLSPGDKDILNDLGKLFLDRGQTREAISCLEAALRADSTFPFALYNLGSAYYRDGDLENARRCLGKVAAAFPGDENVQNNFGVILMESGDITQARNAYQMALKADSAFALTYSNLGNLEATEGRFREAETNYRKALAHDSTFAQAAANLGFLYIEALDRPEDGLPLLERALKLEPDAPWEPRAKRALKELR